MAQYLVFATLADARVRNSAEAATRLCELPTAEWWQTIEHPTDGRAALVIEDGAPYGSSPDGLGLGGLSEDEIAQLQPRDALDADGWFPTSSGD